MTPTRCTCGNVIAEKRAKLGYTLCLDCGEAQAKLETKEKSKHIYQPYNKSGYQYMGSTLDAQRRAARGAGRKTEPQ